MKSWTSLALVAALSAQFFIASPSEVLASTEELEREIFSTIIWRDLQPSLEARQAMAEAVLAYWLNFDSRIPRLSPAEQAWVQAELSTTETERLNRVAATEEFALYSLEMDLEACVAATRDLVAAQSDTVLLQTEMFHWVKVARCYTRTGNILTQLQVAGLSNGRADDSFWMVGHNIILSRIMDAALPAAMADTMGWTLTDE